jgi:hypothetical protein
MRQIPELNFSLDTTLERQLHLEDVLATIPHSSTLAETLETPSVKTSGAGYIDKNGK